MSMFGLLLRRRIGARPAIAVPAPAPVAAPLPRVGDGRAGPAAADAHCNGRPLRIEPAPVT